MSDLIDIPNSQRKEVRDLELTRVLHLRKKGWSYSRIGEAVGRSKQTVYNWVKRALEESREENRQLINELIELECARLDQMTMDAYEVMDMVQETIMEHRSIYKAAASKMASEGKIPPLYEPDAKLVQLHLNHIETLRKISESRRRLLGLDAQDSTQVFVDVNLDHGDDAYGDGDADRGKTLLEKAKIMHRLNKGNK